MLNLEARPGERNFKGQLFIHGNKTGDFVRLHAKGLTLKNVKLNMEPAEIIELDNDEIELCVTDPKALDAEYRKTLKERWGVDCDTVIAIEEFSGKISDTDMHGLYPCYYEYEGEKQELLATQFESHHAREVFPCVDEPAAKAQFMCQVTTAPGVTVLGNMPIKNIVDIEDGDEPSQRVSFEVTPKMSTYLLAFVIGDLQKKSAKTKGGVEVNIYSTKVQPLSSLDFALDVAVRSIDFYDEYFDTKYPLPKSDHVALPDFSSGAMENWGLITYRETCLLAGESISISSKQYIATVIAHELAHQWFGNLTTMKWWNDLWLNESFASLMEHYAVDKLYPNWNIWQSYQTSDVLSALRRDALSGVQPIQQDVSYPDEISTLFDPSIVYAKGERMLRMLQVLIGEDNFRAGLKSYFKKYAYTNAEANDLWQELTDQSNTNVGEVMQNWLIKPGYPVVSVNRTDDEITLRQQQFLVGGESSDTIWQIPLFSNDLNAPRLMKDREISFASDTQPCFQLNVGNFSHFITKYDDKSFADLVTNLMDLEGTDRLKLLNETTMLARAGLSSSVGVFELISGFVNETDNAVWDIIAAAISDLRRIVEDDYQSLNQLKKFTGRLAKPRFDELGIEIQAGEPENNTKLRPVIVSEMIFSEDIVDDTDDPILPLDERPITKQILDLYIKNKHHLEEIAGDIRATALAVAVRFGGESEFDFLLNIYKTSADAELKMDICSGLVATHNSDQIEKLISGFKDPNVVRPQDMSYWFAWTLGNRCAREKTWNWLTQNWNWIDQTFGGDKSFDIFPRYAGQVFRTDSDLAKYEEFFTPMQSTPALGRTISIGVKDIKSRIEWIDRNKISLQAKLKTAK